MPVDPASNLIKTEDNNDFKGLSPEFNHESTPHLEYAFNKMLESTPILAKSQQQEDVIQKPAAEKKGIAILKRALHAEKGADAI